MPPLPPPVTHPQSCDPLAVLRKLSSNETRGLPVVIRFTPGTHVLHDAPFTFSGKTTASSVVLLGAAGAILRTAASNTTIFNVQSGAPHITFRNLELRSQINISTSGDVEIENVTFYESSATLGGALQVSDGNVFVTNTAFVKCRATRGGAVHTSGGKISFGTEATSTSTTSTTTENGCRFERCSADQQGGALMVKGGSVELRQTTYFESNFVGSELSKSNSIEITRETGASFRVEYFLPAPMGRYINNLGQEDQLLGVDGKWEYQDFPPKCLPGFYGDSLDPGVQKTTTCSGLCPIGFTCSSYGTIDPAPCKQGGFCPVGSARAQNCPPGTYGNATEYGKVDQCRACKAGTFCESGSTAETNCAPGTYAVNGSSAVCLSCPADYFQSDFGQTACVECGEGYYCPQGSSFKIPALCNEGTHLERGKVYKNQSDCDVCPPGKWCIGGASEPKLCAAGTSANRTGLAKCDPCPAGRYQSKEGAQNCTACGPGMYCGRGAPLALPCKAGRYSAQLGLTEPDECEECPQGSACATGSTVANECNPGTFSLANAPVCVPCIAGSYQPGTGSTACLSCTEGSYCPLGSAAALPCKEGTFSSRRGLNNSDQCADCTLGAACSTGATEPTNCSAGTYTNTRKQKTCTACPKGKYQQERGTTGCDACAVASFCPNEGTTSPTPCPGGTYSNDTGLQGEWQCTAVKSGEWAPTGAELPEACPASGFICPGRDKDTLNNPPGSKPIIVESGGAVEKVKVDVVEFALELDMGVEDFDDQAEQALIVQLAAELGINASLISLEATSTSVRRSLATDWRRRLNGTSSSNGRLQLQVTVRVPEDFEKASGSASADATIEPPAVIMASLINGRLSGMNITGVTSVSSAVIASREEAKTVKCPRGYWCSAGLTVACDQDFYQEEMDRNFAGACRKCPDNSKSPNSSVSRTDCKCKASADSGGVRTSGFFNADIDLTRKPLCQTCPVGSDCAKDGSTLGELVVAPGYFRVSNYSTDLRPCPDLKSGDDDNSVSASSCVGGVWPDICGYVEDGTIFRDWIAGPYCVLCNTSKGDTSRYMGDGRCKPCAGETTSENFRNVILASLGAALLIAVVIWLRPDKRLRRLRTLIFWVRIGYGRLSLRAKIKNAFTVRPLVLQQCPEHTSMLALLLTPFHCGRSSTR